MPAERDTAGMEEVRRTSRPARADWVVEGACMVQKKTTTRWMRGTHKTPGVVLALVMGEDEMDTPERMGAEQTHTTKGLMDMRWTNKTMSWALMAEEEGNLASKLEWEEVDTLTLHTAAVAEEEPGSYKARSTRTNDLHFQGSSLPSGFRGP